MSGAAVHRRVPSGARPPVGGAAGRAGRGRMDEVPRLPLLPGARDPAEEGREAQARRNGREAADGVHR